MFQDNNQLATINIINADISTKITYKAKQINVKAILESVSS